MAPYQYLFSALKVGPIVLKNRVILAAHATNFWYPPKYETTEQAISYYEERAKGGVAWIVLPVSSVDPKADFFPVCDIPGGTMMLFPVSEKLSRQSINMIAIFRPNCPTPAEPSGR